MHILSCFLSSQSVCSVLLRVVRVPYKCWFLSLQPSCGAQFQASGLLSRSPTGTNYCVFTWVSIGGIGGKLSFVGSLLLAPSGCFTLFPAGSSAAPAALLPVAAFAGALLEAFCAGGAFVAALAGAFLAGAFLAGASLLPAAAALGWPLLLFGNSLLSCFTRGSFKSFGDTSYGQILPSKMDMPATQRLVDYLLLCHLYSLGEALNAFPV